MLNEIQTARLGKEKKEEHSKGGPMVAKDLVWAIAVLTRVVV